MFPNQTIHFLTAGERWISEEYVCGADAVGRRDSRRDRDASQTTCPRCIGTDAYLATVSMRGLTVARPLLVLAIGARTGLTRPAAEAKLADLLSAYGVEADAPQFAGASAAFLLGAAAA